MVYRFFDEKSSGANTLVGAVMEDHKFETRKVYSSFKDNIWGAVQADMKLVKKCSKRFVFSLCVDDIDSNHVWVVPLKMKKVLQLVKLFKTFSISLIAKQARYR